MSKKFIVGLKEHRTLGWVASAYWIEKKSENFSTIDSTINETFLENSETDFTQTQKKIIEISAQFSEVEITKLFSKNTKIPKNFVSNLKDEYVLKQIREYIDRRLLKLLELTKNSEINIYLKADSKNIYDEEQIFFNNDFAQAVFNFEKLEESSKYFLTINDGKSEIKLTEKAGYIIINSPCVLLFDNKIYFFKLGGHGIDGNKLKPFFTKTHINIPKTAERKYFQTFVLKSLENYKVNTKGFRVNHLKAKPKSILLLERNWKNELNFVLKFDYGKITISKNNNKTVFIEMTDKNKFTYDKLVRDVEFEVDRVKTLNKIGLVNDEQFNFKLKTESKDEWALLKWLNKNNKTIHKEGFQIEQSFSSKKFLTEGVKLDFSINENEDWFDLEAVVYFGEFTIPFKNLKNHILNSNREFVLPNGEIAIIPTEWFANFSNFFQFGKIEGDFLKIEKHHFSFIENDNSELSKSILEKINKLLHKTYDLPKNLNATLREYQKTAYNWLNALYENNFGACLADDMGLGKTLQTLAFIQNLKEKNLNRIKNNNKSSKKPQQLSLFDNIESKEIKENEQKAGLIIMPTSLIHNWNNEIIKFTPQLNVLIYKGANRKKKVEDFNNYDIILTSFGLLRNDIEILENYKYQFFIVDESQFIKNPKSKIYNAILKVEADFLMVLTGTPIENSLSDLWAQLNFINDGLLGGLKFFTEEFIEPIEKQNDEDERRVKQERLKKIIAPFILRRKKQEVAKDLPDLTNTIRYCSMSEEQANFYEQEKSKFRNLMLKNIEEDKKEKNNLLALQGLTKLRQIANHPVLVDDELDINSGKFEEITNMLSSLMAENHKVLIFSSFVKHLNLFANYFKIMNWKYSMLTGQTRYREKAIDEFQNNNDNKIFLISLKAGGAGLNLTSADYVFIIDPWWNPAAELQAISRAHRIGQKNKVMAYRFISENTIEQKIVKLQNRKKDLADTFINNNNPFGKLSQTEILDLFD